MEKNKTETNKDDEDSKFRVTDKRHWAHEDDEVIDDSELEERVPTYVEKLKKEAEEKDQRLKEYITAYKNKNAENEEFRMRLQKENEVRVDQLKANFFKKFIPILDNLQRALKSSSNENSLDSLKQGIELIISQFISELKNCDIENIPTLGEKFNPETHEVLLTEETNDPKKENFIVEELEPGYIFKEKLIRPAKVKITKFKKE